MIWVPQLLKGHRGEHTSGLSPRLWKDVYGSMMAPDGGDRLVFVADDFTAIHHAGTMTDLFSAMPYVIYADDTTNHTVKGASDENGGVLQLTIDAGAGANEEIGIEAGDANQQLGQISDTAGADFLTVFECRIKKSSITTDTCWVGLVTPGTVSNGGVIDTNGGPMANKSFIGFNVLADDYDAVDFCYQKASQTRQDKIAGDANLAADDFIKLGFAYNPAAEASKRIAVYINNVEQSTYVTAANIAAATFPDAVGLTFGMAQKGVAGSAALEMAIDWWAFAQLIKPATN